MMNIVWQLQSCRDCIFTCLLLSGWFCSLRRDRDILYYTNGAMKALANDFSSPPMQNALLPIVHFLKCVSPHLSCDTTFILIKDCKC